MTSWVWRTQQRAKPPLPVQPRPGKLVSLVTSSSGAPVACSVGTGSRRLVRTAGPHLRPERPWVEDPRRLLRDDRRLDLARRPGKAAGGDLPRRCQIATGGTPGAAGPARDRGLSCPVPPAWRLLS